MSSQESRCEGCRKVAHELFRGDEPYSNFVFHSNFSELEECAILGCDMCQFLRREFYYVRVLKDDGRRVYDSDAFSKTDKGIQAWILGSPQDLVFWFHVDGHSVYLREGQFVRHHSTDGVICSSNPKAFVKSFEEVLEMADCWIKSCLKNHLRCSVGYDSTRPFTPTRLLDVGVGGNPNSVRLVMLSNNEGELQSSSLQWRHYVTLSYCWGNRGNQSVTTLKNVQDRLEGMRLDKLPGTYQDAVLITRRLGFRYVWIDALCIIQDDSADRNRELLLMGEIYTNSVLTIAASVAEDCGDGFLRRREPTRFPIVECNFTEPVSDRVERITITLLPTLPAWDVLVDNSPLSTRGWAMQERLLASRTLFFTGDCVFWECRELRASEQESDLQHESLRLDELMLRMKKENSAGADVKPWFDLIKTYSRKGFTNQTDKLPAIAGIAAQIETSTRDDYISGLWRSSLCQGLGWCLDLDYAFKKEAPRSRIQSSVPSWSWASVAAPIMLAKDLLPRLNYVETLEFIQLDASHTMTEDQASTLTITPGGRLHLRRYLGAVRYNGPSSRQLILESGYNVFKELKSRFRERLTFDCGEDGRKFMLNPSPLSPTRQKEMVSRELRGSSYFAGRVGKSWDMLCLQVSVATREDKVVNKVLAIILAPTGSSVDDEYRRVGFVEFEDSSVFDAEKTTITLV